MRRLYRSDCEGTYKYRQLHAVRHNTTLSGSFFRSSAVNEDRALRDVALSETKTPAVGYGPWQLVGIPIASTCCNQPKVYIYLRNCTS